MSDFYGELSDDLTTCMEYEYNENCIVYLGSVLFLNREFCMAPDKAIRQRVWGQETASRTRG